LLGPALEERGVFEGERITWSVLRDAAVVQLRGEFDLADVSRLQDACDAAVAAAGPHVVVDLSETTFLDSSVLGVLVGVANQTRQQGGWLRFAAATNPVVRRVIEITMVDQVLGLYATVQEAVDDPVAYGDARAPGAPPAG
jgi:anti-sigma B factor antagonist